MVVQSGRAGGDGGASGGRAGGALGGGGDGQPRPRFGATGAKQKMLSLTKGIAERPPSSTRSSLGALPLAPCSPTLKLAIPGCQAAGIVSLVLLGLTLNVVPTLVVVYATA